MIGFFPTPYPDELIYSIFSRYHKRLGYHQVKQSALDLFGRELRVGLFPTDLDVLLERLPAGHTLMAQELIDFHTLVPYYVPFLTADRVQHLKDSMRRSGGPTKTLHTIVGMKWCANGKDPLRYCPGCAIEDRAKWGETYWHRVHQLPGITVCHLHGELLKSSTAKVMSWGRKGLASAEFVVPIFQERALGASYHPRLMEVAEDAAWLLDHQQGPLEPQTVKSIYRYWLGMNDLIGGSGISVQGLIQKVQAYWPGDVLAQLGYSFLIDRPLKMLGHYQLLELRVGS